MRTEVKERWEVSLSEGPFQRLHVNEEVTHDLTFKTSRQVLPEE
jgi:hypothetical protein